MKIDNRDIFEQIGNAFYAIAADQRIKPLEVAELKLLISNDWLPGGTTSREEAFVSEEAHCILVTMDALQGGNVSASQAFTDFEKFFQLHPEIFTDTLKRKVLKTAGDIVNIFRDDNKAPNKHFEAVRKLLQVRESVSS